MQIAVVKEGDSVDSIASTFQIPVERFIEDNQIEYPYRLAVGQALLIREQGEVEVKPTLGDKTDQMEGKDTGEIFPFKQPVQAGGYAYPFIEQQILRETLPYLTKVLVFSYGFTEEGELTKPPYPPKRILEEIEKGGRSAVMVLTPIKADGQFDSALVSTLVRSEKAQSRLLREMWREAETKGYRGINIDFEYVKAEDKKLYAAFVRRATELFHLFGISLSVALAPKTSADQKGLLYEGIDYYALGAASDEVILMTYEWGYTYSEPMAVAPIHMVRRVAEYALTEIPREKILLGIPNYGYDWPLPYEKGRTRAESLGTLEAIRLAVDHGSVIQFDERSKTPWFRYWQYGVQHEVWFEDVRSLLAKFQLAGELGLRGVMYWQLMRFYRSGWLLLNHLFQVDGAENFLLK